MTAPADPHLPTRTWLRTLLQPEVSADPARPHRPGPGEAERAAAARDVRDGLLRRVVGDVVVAADVRLDAEGRAAALALLLPPGAVALGASAAWVLAGDPLPVPGVLEVALAPAAARRLQRDGSCGGTRVAATRSVPGAHDVLDLGPLRVTTPTRTLLDVARTAPHRAGAVRRALLAAGHDLTGLADTGSAARGAAHVRQARRVLALVPAP
ncbi:hypothetical protein GTR02_19995 [Kineococcus sp. R8]|uniref:hypothetical protein n=1 Tax=Kineococcus siccus TaxID=2696567 RepID=UPI0014124136|nr:hypothetical protein [Kineococcus siccus]NAZ84093.1 hypothetical protein [Kineococcus siccus]